MSEDKKIIKNVKTIEDFKNHPCYKYALDSIDNEDYPRYVRKQCEEFLNGIERQDDESYPYFLDLSIVNRITKFLHLINFASGVRVGTPVVYGLAGFQWFMIVNTLAWKLKAQPEKRRYEKSVLLIARKSGKSFLVGLIFILLLLLEPQYSEFYSVAPDRELSSIVKKEAEQLISVSPALTKHFKLRRGDIECIPTQSKFTPLALSNNRMDGRKANVYVADEVGALPNRGALDAMSSSQMNMINRLGILISTAYNTEANVMTEEIEYCQKVLDGHIVDDACFSLLYMPDEPKKWTEDKALKQANPLAIEVKENYDFLVEQRKKALDMPSAITNFKTKHLNIFVNGDVSEVYVSLDDFKKCRIKDYDWRGKEVYLGLDLSQTTDNTSLAMVTYDKKLKKYVAKVWAFTPESNVEQKIRIEKIDYNVFRDQGFVFFCGMSGVVDYKFVEDFILNLEKSYGVKVKGVGYDRYNCISTAQKLEDNGLIAIEIKQHSSVLHPATKLLKERILQKEFSYIANTLLEINLANCREVKDTNLNSYISKKHSTGKVDMIVSLINAMALWQQEELDGFIYESDMREEGFLIL